MVLLASVIESDGSARIRDELTTELIARVFNPNHAARLVRDSVLAEAVWNARALATTARRTAVRTAIADWVAAGGRLLDLRLLLSVVQGGNQALELAGIRRGYFHGEVYPAARPLRWIALAEDLFEGEALATTALRNAALDAAVTVFVTAGGIV